MSIDLACRYPATFAGILGISGYVYGVEKYPEAFSKSIGDQKFFISHGTQDGVLPINSSREQVNALKKLGVNIRWREYAKDHTIEPQAEKQEIVEFLQEITNAQ